MKPLAGDVKFPVQWDSRVVHEKPLEPLKPVRFSHVEGPKSLSSSPTSAELNFACRLGCTLMLRGQGTPRLGMENMEWKYPHIHAQWTT